MEKKTLQMITPKEALDLLKEGKQICIIKEYSLEDELSVMELLTEDLAAVVEQDAPETPKKSGGGIAPKKKLDWGKIKALADAGWPHQKIAEEMGCTASTVATGLSRLRRGAEDGKEKTTTSDTSREEGNQ